MKRDGLKLEHATLEEFRLLAVRRVKAGEKPADLVKSPRMNRTSIYRWLKASSGRGKGERALAARPATGRPSKLTPTQQAQVFRWINGKDPRHPRLDFGLWTRQIAGSTGLDAANATATRPSTRLSTRPSTRPSSHRVLAARDLSLDGSGCERPRRGSLLLGRIGISRRTSARQDLGTASQDTGDPAARTTPVALRGLGRQRQRRVLVRDLPGGAECAPVD